MKYYSLDRILEKKATYNMVFGERSNGKTYASLKHMLNDWVKHHRAGAYIRRYEEDLVGKKGAVIFDALVDNGVVLELTNNEYQCVVYKSRAYYLAKYDEKLKKYITQEEPFCYAFALSTDERYKGGSYPTICNIVFDEFMTRDSYLQNEFVRFTSILSTIIRQRDNVIVFMLANTVNKYCPYFGEMGLKHIKEMEQGDIDIYEYDGGLKVAVEYAGTAKENGGKKSDKYFAFEGTSKSRLQMITSGAWEIPMYPRVTWKTDRHNIIFKFFVKFDEELLQCDIYRDEYGLYIHCHTKTSDMRDDKYPFFELNFSPQPNHYIDILRPTDNVTKKIGEIFKKQKVFFGTNEDGELLRNYLDQAGKFLITNL